MFKFVLILTFLSAPYASAAILLDEYGSSTRTVAEDGWALRSQRKAGVGLGSAGVHGIFGANIEINFTPKKSFMTNFGYSSKFQSFGFQVKHTFGGRYFSPYFNVGYARWFSNTEKGQVGKTTPKFFAEKFLNDEEKKIGKFAEDLIFSGLGFQYMQLSGPWSGSSVYAEILMMVDVEDLQAAPTGGLGYMYYF